MTLEVAYRRERKEGHRAHVALAVARQKIREPEFDWKDGVPYTAKLTREGFDIRIRVDYEDSIDRDLTWTNREWELPDRHRSVYRTPHGSLVRDDDTWHGMVWKGWDHRWAYCVPTVKVAELAAYYHDHEGQSQSVALDRARENVREVVKMYCDDQYAEYVISVAAHKKGVELGSDSLGGVDISDDATWRSAEVEFEQTISDHGMIDNAIAEARETLKELCAA